MKELFPSSYSLERVAGVLNACTILMIEIDVSTASMERKIGSRIVRNRVQEIWPSVIFILFFSLVWFEIKSS